MIQAASLESKYTFEIHEPGLALAQLSIPAHSQLLDQAKRVHRESA